LIVYPHENCWRLLLKEGCSWRQRKIGMGKMKRDQMAVEKVVGGKKRRKKQRSLEKVVEELGIERLTREEVGKHWMIERGLEMVRRKVRILEKKQAEGHYKS